MALKHFFLDVDGVMTNGDFYYTEAGKIMKVFGPDDHDALVLCQSFVNVRFVTGDKKGFPVSRRRIVDDMNMKLDLVSTHQRAEWLASQACLDEVVYMGDGIFDGAVFDKVAYSIAPSNAFYKTREKAMFVTRSPGGQRAVAEACIHLIETFFPGSDFFKGAGLPLGSGEWAVDVH